MPEVENKNEDIKVLIITGNKIKGHNLQNSLGINEDLKLVGVAEKATETYYIIESLSPEIIVSANTSALSSFSDTLEYIVTK